MHVSTTFNNEDMQIEVTYPLVVRVGDSTTQVQDFSTSVDIRFRPIYELSRNIYQKTKQDPEWIDVSYLSSQPYPIRLIRVSDDTLVYEISDSFDSTEFVYRFAMKYNL